MSNFESDGESENPWDERGELAWNEFDWERYLRTQEQSILRYLSLYDAIGVRPDRIDQVAEKMGWDCSSLEEDGPADESAPPEGPGAAEEIYTLHKNPIYIATRAISLSVIESWRKLAAESGRLPANVGVGLLSALHRAEGAALEAVYALEFGDYAMAVSLFKRALLPLNEALALAQDPSLAAHRRTQAWQRECLPRIFDLREIWLRVIAECRSTLTRPMDGEDE
ncbi:MAG: hypothetical protein HZC55_27070 [Verrucomicrobia bacterium]|nr:hypothetical protein [Verrucomicrobiota bacterium]